MKWKTLKAIVLLNFMAWMQTPQWKALQKNNFIQKLESTWYRIPWSKQKWILMQKRKTALAVFLFLLYIRKRKEERGEALLFLKNVVWWRSAKKCFIWWCFEKNQIQQQKNEKISFKKDKRPRVIFGFSLLTEEEMDSWSGKRKGKMGFFGIIFSFFMVFFKNKRESTSWSLKKQFKNPRKMFFLQKDKIDRWPQNVLQFDRTYKRAWIWLEERYNVAQEKPVFFHKLTNVEQRSLC